MPPPTDAYGAALSTRVAPFGEGLTPSLPEAFRSIAIPNGAHFWRKMMAFAGPGCLIAVGYMDPGNWATDIAGGSRFGYALLPVILISNLVAMFLQHLSLKLGIASGRDLAQLCKERFSPRTAIALWVGAEVAIIACDLAEVIGVAVALKLLFHLPLLYGVALTVLDALVVLTLMRKGFRYIEAFAASLIGIIAACFAIELFLAHPALGTMVGALAPSPQIIANPVMLYIALGIFGATVMPHNLYLHSSIAQTRSFDRTVPGRREAIKFSGIDSGAALIFAMVINAAILILAASVFNTSGHTAVAEIEDAYRLLAPLLGVAGASLVFALALLASGQNSTLTGTMAGQIVMEGFLGLKLHPAVRRLLTRGLAVIPALVVIAIIGDKGAMQLLILSQVVLSMQLGFAVVPLIIFTSDPKLMGVFANKPWVKKTGFVVAAVILAANAFLIFQSIHG
jgi:manganese transport protein